MSPTPQPTHPRNSLLALLLVLLASVALLAPSAAHAGRYTITNACADWELQRHPAADASADRCDHVLRNSVQRGAPPAGNGDTSRWLYNAPPNTRISHASTIVHLAANSGWRTSITLDRGLRIACPPTCGPQDFRSAGGPLSAPSTQLALELRCAAASCPRDRVYADLLAYAGASIEIEDISGPSVTITGGSLLEGWRSGPAHLLYDASDNVGIARSNPVVGGAGLRYENRPCSFSRKIPCPNGGGRFDVDTRGFSDGAHVVTVEAVDSAGNVGRAASKPVLIDNTPPAGALDFGVLGGDGWRRSNGFDVTWVSPRQDAAPITGLVYRLCPEGTPLATTSGCQPLQTATRLEPVDPNTPGNATRVEDLRVPRVGAYQARFFLRDAAGNASEATGVTKTLRFDPDPPTLAFLGQDPTDPARLRVRASDATSGIAHADIEIQRDGEPMWRLLPVQLGPDGFSAFIDDEQLAKGTYVVRARAVDHAGNEASSNQRENGSVATLKLPIRLRSQLRVGARGERRCNGRGKQRSCRTRLRTRVGLSYHASKMLYGRLRANGRPLPGTTVEVWRQTKLPGAPLERIATIQTSRTGRFALRAPRGPARTLRFRYPGTQHIRGTQADVRMRVRGSTTFRRSPTRVVNGEYVTLRGRVRGGPLPPTGKLVELQVYARRRWRTFAQPRTDAQGRWAYRYRFEQIQRTTRFRFRARLRAEPQYPYETGTSRVQRVLVRGGQ